MSDTTSGTKICDECGKDINLGFDLLYYKVGGRLICGSCWAKNADTFSGKLLAEKSAERDYINMLEMRIFDLQRQLTQPTFRQMLIAAALGGVLGDPSRAGTPAEFAKSAIEYADAVIAREGKV